MSCVDVAVSVRRYLTETWDFVFKAVVLHSETVAAPNYTKHKLLHEVVHISFTKTDIFFLR